MHTIPQTTRKQGAWIKRGRPPPGFKESKLSRKPGFLPGLEVGVRVQSEEAPLHSPRLLEDVTGLWGPPHPPSSPRTKASELTVPSSNPSPTSSPGPWANGLSSLGFKMRLKAPLTDDKGTNVKRLYSGACPIHTPSLGECPTPASLPPSSAERQVHVSPGPARGAWGGGLSTANM